MSTISPKTKKIKKQAAPNMISAVYQDGVLKPLTKVDFKEGEELTLILVAHERSIAEQMYGLFATPNGIDIDEVIEDEDWL